MKSSNFISWNEEMAKKYNPEKYYKNPSFIIRFVENMRIRKIIEIIKQDLKGDTKILDAGCGSGYLLSFIPDGKLFGIDISEFLLNIAKKRLGKKAKLFKSFVENTQFSDNFFDITICTEVIEHTINPKDVCKELARITKPTGKLIFSIPNDPLINILKIPFRITNTLHKFFPGIANDMTEEWHLHSFSLNKFKEYSNSVLNIKKIIPIPCIFLPIRYILICTKVFRC